MGDIGQILNRFFYMYIFIIALIVSFYIYEVTASRRAVLLLYCYAFMCLTQGPL